VKHENRIGLLERLDSTRSITINPTAPTPYEVLLDELSRSLPFRLSV
jgi:hypothetical protein